MKTTVGSLLLSAGIATANPLAPRSSGVQGFDISSYQGTVDFSGAYSSGARFVIIKVRISVLRSGGTGLTQPGHRGHQLYRLGLL